jgi:mannose-1-phosphate guanylyltransferase
MVVVDTDDALLICPKERAQEVRDLVERLKESGKGEHL